MSEGPGTEVVQVLDAIAAVLLRCFIITVVALLFVWVVACTMGDWIHALHTNWFEITRAQYDLFILYSLTFMKTLNVVFFLFPCVAIKLYTSKVKRQRPVS
ncbi:MAG: DUF6868 family protein [Planctomycetota bacterium]|jgi:uncharacterized membrane protein YciS (DUF1049 family)